MSIRMFRKILPWTILALASLGCGGDDDNGGDDGLINFGDNPSMEQNPSASGNGDGLPIDEPNASENDDINNGGMDNGDRDNGDMGEDGLGNLGGLPGATPGCTQSGFQAANQRASQADFGLQYSASTGGTPQNLLLAQIYQSFDGPTTPGRYDLTGVNYRDCGLCLLSLKNCTGQNCDKTFYADEGTVEITALDDNRFAARFENVVFHEVTIGEGSVSTRVPGGETWCMDGYSFDQDIVEAPSGGGGAEPPDGLARVGDTVPDFSLMNCGSGELVSMRDFFQGEKAAIFVATAGWCPACSEVVPQLVDIENMYEGIKAAYILGDDQSYRQPTQRYCQQYASQHNVPLERMFMDHDGQYSYAITFSNIWPYLTADGAIGLPFKAVMSAVNWEYLYADRAPGGDFSAAINQALSQ